MIPHERSLVEEYADRPFALLGVNADPDPAKIRKQTKDAVNWRSFWDGPLGGAGPTSTQWNITAWPTVFLFDHEGVLRRTWRGVPKPAELDPAIEALVTTAEKAR